MLEVGIINKPVNRENYIVLPNDMQKDVTRKVNDNGHFGVKKMTEMICNGYFIPKLVENLETVVYEKHNVPMNI